MFTLNGKTYDETTMSAGEHGEMGLLIMRIWDSEQVIGPIFCDCNDDCDCGEKRTPAQNEARAALRAMWNECKRRSAAKRETSPRRASRATGERGNRRG